MSYFRRAMGDGPITDPSQLDDGTIVGTTGPTRVDCSQLSLDSPFRAPGQPCAPTDSGSSSQTNGGETPLDWLLGLIKSDVAAATPSATAPAMSDGSKWLLGGAAALGLYYYFRRKR